MDRDISVVTLADGRRFLRIELDDSIDDNSVVDLARWLKRLAKAMSRSRKAKVVYGDEGLPLQ
jgi:hypothetical protein